MSLEWAAATLYPSLTWLASRLTSYSQLALRRASIHEGKMLLTDVCNRLTTRAPENRSTPEPAAFAAETASVMCRSVSPDAIRRTAPDRLSAIRPQVEQRLTAPPQLRTNLLRLSLLLLRRRRAPRFGGRFLFAALSAAQRLVIRPLTLPVAPCVVTQRKR